MKGFQNKAKMAEEKINLYTRIAALVLSIAQAVGIVVAYSDGLDVGNALWAGAPTWLIGMGVVIILVAGGMFTVWIGERITDLGVGNGMSLLIFVGILSSSMSSIAQGIALATEDITVVWTIVLYIVAVVLIFGLIVFVDSAERKVPIQYAKQIKGRKMYGGQSTFIPIKVNGSGVIPIIFASALFNFPTTDYFNLRTRVNLVSTMAGNKLLALYRSACTFNFGILVLLCSNHIQPRGCKPSEFNSKVASSLA